MSRAPVRLLRALLLLAAGLAAAVAPQARAQTVTATWNGTSGNWTDAALWNVPPNFPNNGQGGFNYNAVVNGGGTLTLDQAIVIEQLTFSSGTITGANDLTMNALFTWNGGTLSGS